jgi:hypothetical protein
MLHHHGGVVATFKRLDSTFCDVVGVDKKEGEKKKANELVVTNSIATPCTPRKSQGKNEKEYPTSECGLTLTLALSTYFESSCTGAAFQWKPIVNEARNKVLC